MTFFQDEGGLIALQCSCRPGSSPLKGLLLYPRTKVRGRKWRPRRSTSATSTFVAVVDYNGSTKQQQQQQQQQQMLLQLLSAGMRTSQETLGP